MLRKLTIQNYALIDNIDIDFDRGLNILTGETGAGKSIILGALGLVMGKRADLKTLFDPKKNCMVEATIDISSYQLDKLLEDNDIEPETEVVIRRVISKSGKSRAFINDLPVGLKTLEAIASNLIQLHHQFDNLDLGDPAYQLKMLDALAGNKNLLIDYQNKFLDWQDYKTRLKKLLDDQAEFHREKEFIQFQFDELTEIDLDTAKEDDIDSTLELLSNAEAIQQALQAGYFAISEDDASVINRLNEQIKGLQQAGSGTHIIEEIVEKLQLQSENLLMLSNELYDHAERIEYDPVKIEELQNKQDLLNKLMLKHRLDDIEQLIQLKDDLQQKLTKEMEVGEEISRIESKINSLESTLSQKAEKLSRKRHKIASEFSNKIVKQLKNLAMPFAMIEGSFRKLETIGPLGFDFFELLFSANKGGKPGSIGNVASGGELSRLSLVIKSILAGNMSLPTLIFDEIEAGISGEIAKKMGFILKHLSHEHQIINITHSAQIASRSNRHFFVYKSHESERSITRIRVLNSDEKIAEIAKMLSGDPPTPTAIKNAEELIHLN